MNTCIFARANSLDVDSDDGYLIDLYNFVPKYLTVPYRYEYYVKFNIKYLANNQVHFYFETDHPRPLDLPSPRPEKIIENNKEVKNVKNEKNIDKKNDVNDVSVDNDNRDKNSPLINSSLDKENIRIIEGGKNNDEKKEKCGFGVLSPYLPFTLKAKKSLTQAMGAIEKEFSVSNNEVLFLTSTLPGNTPRAIEYFARYQGLFIKNLHDRINYEKKKYEKKNNVKIEYGLLRVAEIQKRGALHFHHVISCKEKEFLEIIKSKWKKIGFDLLNNISNRIGVDLFERDRGKGSWKDTPEVLQWDCQYVKKSLMGYLSKYLSKQESKNINKNSGECDNKNGKKDVIYYYPNQWSYRNRLVGRLVKKYTLKTEMIRVNIDDMESIIEKVLEVYKSLGIKEFKYYPRFYHCKSRNGRVLTFFLDKKYDEEFRYGEDKDKINFNSLVEELKEYEDDSDNDCYQDKQKVKLNVLTKEKSKLNFIKVYKKNIKVLENELRGYVIRGDKEKVEECKEKIKWYNNEIDNINYEKYKNNWNDEIMIKDIGKWSIKDKMRYGLLEDGNWDYSDYDLYGDIKKENNLSDEDLEEIWEAMDNWRKEGV